jgi:hypothetical protein
LNEATATEDPSLQSFSKSSEGILWNSPDAYDCIYYWASCYCLEK